MNEAILQWIRVFVNKNFKCGQMLENEICF